MSVGQAIILIFVILCLAYPVWVALRSINWKRSETTDLRKSAAGFWITVGLLAVLVGYPLSMGPACWLTSRLEAGTRAIAVIYRPIFFVSESVGSDSLDSAIRWYAGLGSARGWRWQRFRDANGEVQWVWIEMPGA